MAVTLKAGVEPSTENTANNPRDMEDRVFELEPDVAPLTLLLAKLNSRPAKNPKIEWLEDEPMPRLTTLSASAASNATAFGVTADIFRVNDVVRFTSQGFAIYVTATAAGAITGAQIGGTAQASAANSSEVYIVGTSDVEGNSIREIKYPQLVNASNYCQIFKTPFGVTETEKWTEHYGGDEELRHKAKFGVEHAGVIERGLFFGARDIKNTNQRFAGGVVEFIATNVTNDTGGLTEDDWQTFLMTGFRYGSAEKTAFCSPKVIKAVEGFARANLKVNDDVANRYGIMMKTYVSGQGVVNLVLKRDWNDSSNYGGYAFLLDLDALRLRYMRGTKTRLWENVQAPDYDGRKHEYRSELSLEVIHERRHAKLTGVT